ncbi:hypothetical protein J2W68_002179 [Luteimonas terrae]|uniref:Uncharacterized protein n=1 Tax=Luteimonas terrae TaxID=1530191 RepID=A0ABU1XXE3_9GAMM|nr:hypothetical protein [Luteimonas terrae]
MACRVKLRHLLSGAQKAEERRSHY